jgi:two-component system sensor histidine kinase UhpB
MKRSDSLLHRTLAANLLLVTATLFAASLAAGLDLTIQEQRRQFLILALAIVLTLLVNWIVLRRRFSPLERLIERVEALDPADPPSFELPGGDLALEEVERLAGSFRRLLERIESERNRAGRMVVRAQEEERKRVARDLHDEANQALAAITLRLEALRQDAPPALAADLAETKRLAGQAMEELLRLARQLRPAALDDHGLVPALDGQVRRFREQTGIQAQLSANGDLIALDDDRQLVVYRVAQEALNNVARHSRASAVAVSLQAANGAVRLEVADDGRGFAPRSEARGLGLDGMAERARLVGGDVDVLSAPGRGTRVSLSVPLRGAA